MKLKKKEEKNNLGNGSQNGEEFFELPRAEYLAEEFQQSGVRQIGDLVTNPSQHIEGRFTLEVKDNLMQGAGIRTGDFVVIEQQVAYPEGCLLAVQLGNQQLVRRYTRAGGRIHLQCDPPTKQLLIVEDHTPDFRILGQVIQIVREIR